MATVLEDCTTENQRSFAHFLWAKGLSTKDTYKEMFSVYGGKCSSHKAVHNWVEKFSPGRSKVAEVEMELRKCLGQQSKRLLCSGFRRSDKAMGQVYQCRWRICREINGFFATNIICCTFYIHL
jgi:hypothetical protein